MQWRKKLHSKPVTIVLALFATLVLNLALFSLLPHLMQTQQEPLVSNITPAIAVVHVSPPKPPQRQQAIKKPAQQVVKKERIAQSKAQAPRPELQLNLMLRPEIPNSLGQVAMPEVALASLEPLPTIFDSAALDQPLTALVQSPFIYPLRAKRLGIEGWVRIRLLISKQGDVERVEIVEAQPKNVFEQTVERGVRTWRFTPGTVAGETVRSWVITTIRFELES